MTHLENWTQLLRFLADQRTLLIWGTGAFSEVVTDYVTQHGFSIWGYIESQPKSLDFLGKPVFPPQTLRESVPNSQHFILIASAFHDEIAQTCDSIGFTRYADYLHPLDYDQYPRGTRHQSNDRNILIELPASDVSTSEAYRLIVWENEYRLPPDMTGWNVIDIGANVGSFMVAATLRHASSILCVEPSRNLFPLLTKNCKTLENATTRISPLQNAMGSRRCKELYFLESPWANNSLMGRSVAHVSTGGYPVRVENLTQILSQHPHVDLIKIDCEGAEFEVLMDVKPTLFDRCVDRVCGEWHDGMEGQNQLWKLLRYFHEMAWNVTYNTSPATMRCGLFWAVNSKLDPSKAFDHAFMFTPNGIEAPTWKDDHIIT